ncbi:MAG: F0F1 ATP synthase subunit alpha [Bacillota bacterium]
MNDNEQYEVIHGEKPAQFFSTLKNRINEFEASADIYQQGVVMQSGDGIVEVKGLKRCKYDELLEFASGAYGIALNLVGSDTVGAVVLGDAELVSQGMKVRSTEQVVTVPVGEGLLGRVINPLGQPQDGKGRIHSDKSRPIESPAPTIMMRQPVKEPLQTGLMAIDSMVPIGRGQRELIIGDRQTGKTAITIDTIINQRGNGVICIYVAIGQKASTISQIVAKLQEKGAMEYSIVVSSTASDSAPMQYIAPYAGCAIAEEFMHNGKDVLIVYDDLSKHAVAYRAMSLLLRRPPGREAYPGDVFYLHSRLLERAARLSDEYGGGSMTALPIIETMEGDISAYIPTNVISITDGQIYLESELFHAGVRPAVNVGLSVSRVGGSAQSKAMRKVAGKLRLDLAQYRELAVFSRFGSDLDAATQELLAQGERITQTLKQEQYRTMPTSHQVIVLYMATRRHLLDIPVSAVRAFNAGFVDFVVTRYPEVTRVIEHTGDLDEATQSTLEQAIVAYKQTFHADSPKE